MSWTVVDAGLSNPYVHEHFVHAAAVSPNYANDQTVFAGLTGKGLANYYTFANKTGVTPSTVVTSNTVTISSINSPAPISITGGEYSVNGGL